MKYIKNAINPLTNKKTSILIKDDKIYKKDSDAEKLIAENSFDYKIIDAKNNYVMTSFTDTHFHLRNPGFEYKQTYEEAAIACMKGGYTDVIAMANTKPVCDKVEVFDTIKAGMKNLPLRVYQVGSVTKNLQGKELTDYKKLLEYTHIFSDDGKNVDDPEIMKQALKLSAEYNFLIMDHSQPETEMVIRNIKLAEETGGRLHFCHISKKNSALAIIKAKEKNTNITFEVTPHHIFSSNLDYRVNPPIAGEEDRKFLIDAIKKGYVDSIGTDHAPHTQEDKQNGSPGIINIENSYSMVNRVFYDNDIPKKTLIQMMCIFPSDLIGKTRSLEPGNVADIVIFDDKDDRLDINKLSTRSKNTPYDKREIKGHILMTICSGKIEYNTL